MSRISSRIPKNNFAKNLKFLGNLIKTKPASESNRRNRTVPGKKQLFGLSPCRSFEEAGVSFLRSRGNPTRIARARQEMGLGATREEDFQLRDVPSENECQIFPCGKLRIRHLCDSQPHLPILPSNRTNDSINFRGWSFEKDAPLKYRGVFEVGTINLLYNFSQ